MVDERREGEGEATGRERWGTGGVLEEGERGEEGGGREGRGGRRGGRKPGASLGLA